MTKPTATLIGTSAGCYNCNWSTDDKKAKKMAEDHVAAHPGHVVEITFNYTVKEGKK